MQNLSLSVAPTSEEMRQAVVVGFFFRCLVISYWLELTPCLTLQSLRFSFLANDNVPPCFTCSPAVSLNAGFAMLPLVQQPVSLAVKSNCGKGVAKKEMILDGESSGQFKERKVKHLLDTTWWYEIAVYGRVSINASHMKEVYLKPHTI